MKNLYRETTSNTATFKRFIKVPNRKRISNEQFHLYESEISLKLYKYFFKRTTF